MPCLQSYPAWEQVGPHGHYQTCKSSFLGHCSLGHYRPKPCVRDTEAPVGTVAVQASGPVREADRVSCRDWHPAWPSSPGSATCSTQPFPPGFKCYCISALKIMHPRHSAPSSLSGMIKQHLGRTNPEPEMLPFTACAFMSTCSLSSGLRRWPWPSLEWDQSPINSHLHFGATALGLGVPCSQCAPWP